MINKPYWIDFHFLLDQLTRISCPTCKEGYLVDKDDFVMIATRKWNELEKKEDANELYFEAKFTGFLKCNCIYCQEVIAVIGTVYNEPVVSYSVNEVGHIGTQFYKYFKPEYFSPPLEIIPTKSLYPPKINLALKNAFSLYFADVESCANKIRVTVETLLDSLRVKKTSTRNHKRTKLKLHKRIVEYDKINPAISELLLSIKWIGNFGSHNSELQREDLLDAFNLMQSVLDKIYDDHESYLKKLSKNINKMKKPPSQIKKKK